MLKLKWLNSKFSFQRATIDCQRSEIHVMTVSQVLLRLIRVWKDNSCNVHHFALGFKFPAQQRPQGGGPKKPRGPPGNQLFLGVQYTQQPVDLLLPLRRGSGFQFRTGGTERALLGSWKPTGRRWRGSQVSCLFSSRTKAQICSSVGLRRPE